MRRRARVRPCRPCAASRCTVHRQLVGAIADGRGVPRMPHMLQTPRPKPDPRNDASCMLSATRRPPPRPRRPRPERWAPPSDGRSSALGDSRPRRPTVPAPGPSPCRVERSSSNGRSLQRATDTPPTTPQHDGDHRNVPRERRRPPGRTRGGLTSRLAPVRRAAGRATWRPSTGRRRRPRSAGCPGRRATGGPSSRRGAGARASSPSTSTGAGAASRCRS